MRNVIIALVAALLCGPAFATFELRDPAADLEAWQKAIYSKNTDGSKQAETHLMICRLGSENEYCECRNKESDEKLDLSFEACRKLVEKHANEE
jgi:hypothetical protein